MMDGVVHHEGANDRDPGMVMTVFPPAINDHGARKRAVVRRGDRGSPLRNAFVERRKQFLGGREFGLW